MYMNNFLNRLGALKIVPVLVRKDVKEGILLGMCLRTGGRPATEVTFGPRPAPAANRPSAVVVPGMQ